MTRKRQDTRRAGLLAAARFARKLQRENSRYDNPTGFVYALASGDIARWCEREARKQDRGSA